MNLLILVAKAGAGKTTAAEILRKRFDAALIAQADPLKEFTRGIFDFSKVQLYGPSEARNGVDPRFTEPNSRHWGIAREGVEGDNGRVWIESLLPTADDETITEAHRSLIMWFADLHQHAARAGGLSPRAALQTLGTEWGRNALGDQVWIETAYRDAAHSKAPLVVITDGRFPNEVEFVRAVGGKALRILDPDGRAAEAANAAGIAGHESEAAEFGPADVDLTAINPKAQGLDAFADVLDVAARKLFPTLTPRSNP
jgi:hypothetical protein